MKQHKFEVIRWLGEKSRPEQFGVVEIDGMGPILRGGPFGRHQANREADRLQRVPPERPRDGSRNGK